jgi:hypothetical protein
VLGSLAFWICLLLAAGAYGLATLAPTYVQNRQLAGEYAAAEARVRGLVAQIDRYEQYCTRLTAANDSGPAPESRGLRADPSTRPLLPQHFGLSRRPERGGEGGVTIGAGKAGVPLQQVAVDESLQFHLEDTDADESAAPPPAVAPVISLVNRSPLVCALVRVFAGGLLLLAFTFCTDAPHKRTPAARPRRAAFRLRNPLTWLYMRYRSAG